MSKPRTECRKGERFRLSTEEKLGVCKRCGGIGCAITRETIPAENTLAGRSYKNRWDHIDDVIRVLQKVREGTWSWSRNWDCKYLDVRIDMRDGGCIIRDNSGERISLDMLNWQYETDGPERPTIHDPIVIQSEGSYERPWPKKWIVPLDELEDKK